MIIGLPKEIKDNEYRVAVTPGGARQLVDSGHEVLVQVGAGEGSSFSDSRVCLMISKRDSMMIVDSCF